MARKYIVGGKVYKETDTRKVIVGGKVLKEVTSGVAPTFKAGWATRRAGIIGGGL